MAPDGRKDGRTDNAKTISLRLWRGLKNAVKCGRSFSDKYLPTRGSREKCKKEGLSNCYQCGLAVRSEIDLKEHDKPNMPGKYYIYEECFKRTVAKQTSLDT
ncbi:hypothetical protein DPMN_079473 [Dreissena polymorpha]|uniref:C2H2-type domain-containing protein n=1 Tax=Dreissena polymorpha TaxID=45954 RepID=A0A9D4BT06_DREPO|nr:hypothetical protein DPMN_079473 [Dreissena polymorpha]